ncbi:hypothetical protein MHYP_G00252450 [Metynnis hypsauchen]
MLPRRQWWASSMPMWSSTQPGPSRSWRELKKIIRGFSLPAIDNIKYNTFEVQQYANAAHGYNWGLWCMYIIPPQDWLDKGDETAPIRYRQPISFYIINDDFH